MHYRFGLRVSKYFQALPKLLKRRGFYFVTIGGVLCMYSMKPAECQDLEEKSSQKQESKCILCLKFIVSNLRR